MERKIKLIILLFICSINVGAQNKIVSGKVYYDVVSDIDKKNYKYEMLNQEEPECKVFLEKPLKAELRFNSERAVYDLIGEIRESSCLNIIKMNTYQFVPMYTEKEETRTPATKHRGDSAFNTFNNIDWKITSESKTIQGFTCYKAIAEKRNEYKGAIKIVPIVAWFTPDINYSYGPGGFHGLPGLILYAQFMKATYSATKIVLSDKGMDVPIPKAD
ncbi:GLPGLI family protein [Myroides odoratimimus]|uniref:GLPGLI family protein n=1 Tax=Myroides odoratimimus TaxID=76832 RepID=UPI0025777C2D|nr:GLPGLI family protein [Myroides odoratimimus]MDM1396512.1 GLPGLI family protein [Myroides odoratimimus]